MKLVGRYMSPFTRRVAISATLLGIDFEHLDLSTLTDQDEIRKLNPLGRVPVAVLDDGTCLAESSAILDWLDLQCAPETRLVPSGGLDRRHVLQLVGFATGAGEKTVAAFYELTRRPEDKIHRPTVSGNIAQVHAAYDALEEAAAHSEGWLVGNRLTQADISAVVFFEFSGVALSRRFDRSRYSALPELCDRARNSYSIFGETYPG